MKHNCLVNFLLSKGIEPGSNACGSRRMGVGMDILLQKGLDKLGAFLIVNHERKVIYANKIFASLLGFTKSELIGMNMEDFILNSNIDSAFTGKTEISALPVSFLSHKRKTPLLLQCDCKPIRTGSSLTGILIIPVKGPLRSLKAAGFGKEKNVLDLIIGGSQPIQEMKSLIQSLSKSHLSILITGETGVGKEIFARVIHRMSNPTLENFRKVNCAAMNEEWFRMEVPRSGTLFLDEIAELPLSFQARMLQLFQNEGSDQHDITCKETRIIASTNQRIEHLIEMGKFRQDLYYRINTIEMEIPPLRERKEDIDSFCQYFIDKINRENNFCLKGIEADVGELFQAYDWPGNVRELKHVLQRLAILNPDGLLRRKDCEFIRQRIEQEPAPPSEQAAETLLAQRIESEKKAIINALQEASYNKTKAAQILSIDRSALYKKMKRYQIQAEKNKLSKA